jgi:OOP family OmpA-OmpF porin
MSDGDKDVWGNRGVLFRAGGSAEPAELEAEVIPDAFEQPKIVCGSPVLNNVLFGKDSAALDSAAIDATNDAFESLREFPTDTVVVEGHTCDLGDSTYNHDLGLRRAQAVANYLIDQGIEPSRVSAKSYGATTPAVPNDIERNRALNRRAVFRFTLGE